MNNVNQTPDTLSDTRYLIRHQTPDVLPDTRHQTLKVNYPNQTLMVHLQAYLFCDLSVSESQSVGVNMVNLIVPPDVSDILGHGVSLGVDQELTQHTCWTFVGHLKRLGSCLIFSIW